MRLPLNLIELLECFSFRKDFRSVGSEDLEIVVYFQTLIENLSEEVSSASRPGHLSGAGRLGLANLFALVEGPQVHLSLSNISKTTNHQGVDEWANSDRVSESLAKLEMGLTLSVVHGSSGRLLTRNYDEVLSICSPLNVLHLIVEYRNVSPSFALVYSYILQRMLSIVTLTGGVIQTLGPHQNRMT